MPAPQEDVTGTAPATCQPQNLSPWCSHCRFSAWESVGVGGVNKECFQLLCGTAALQRKGLGSPGVRAQDLRAAGRESASFRVGIIPPKFPDCIPALMLPGLLCAGFQVGLVPWGWVWDPELCEHPSGTDISPSGQPHPAFSARPLILQPATKNSGGDLPLPPRCLQDSSGELRTGCKGAGMM